MAHLLTNARSLLTHRGMLPAYLAWSASHSFRRPSRLQLPCGGRLAEFRDFSEYWSNRDLIPTRGEQLLLGTYLRPGGVALDIGANIGMFSVTMGRLCDSALIFSFEPAQKTYERLLRNLRRNALANVVAEHRAMGKQAGMVRLAVDPKSSAISRIALDHEGEERGRTFEVVPCTTIDDFCAERGIEALDFVKIDVEGAEPQVLAGAAGMLGRRAIRCLLIEICPGTLAAMGSHPRELADLVHSFDYRFYAIGAGGETGQELTIRDLEAMFLENVAMRPSRV